jgi:hypothetical protein
MNIQIATKKGKYIEDELIIKEEMNEDEESESTGTF